ncbi:MAG: YqzL family protein [Clostridia bacterium]
MECKSILWKLFEKTGSPSDYLLYKALVKDEHNGSEDGRKT